MAAQQPNSQKQKLADFLRQCDSLHERAVQNMVRPPWIASSDDVQPDTPVGPEHILPWTTFSEAQAEVWSQHGEHFWNKCAFSSTEDIAFMEERVKPISVLRDLLFLHKMVVLPGITKMFEVAIKNGNSRSNLSQASNLPWTRLTGFRGPRSFPYTVTMTGRGMRNQYGQMDWEMTAEDRICVQWHKGGRVRPLVAILFKTKNALDVNEICTGLQSAIHIEQGILHKDEVDDVASRCKKKMAVVVTELFSYMIEQKVQYGCICIGGVFVFVRISKENSTTVYYSVNIPAIDQNVDVHHQLLRTAVAQMFAFVHQAATTAPPTRGWRIRAKSQLRKWRQEYSNMIHRSPEEVQQAHGFSDYHPVRWPTLTVHERRAGEARTMTARERFFGSALYALHVVQRNPWLVNHLNLQ